VIGFCIRDVRSVDRVVPGSLGFVAVSSMRKLQIWMKHLNLTRSSSKFELSVSPLEIIRLPQGS